MASYTQLYLIPGDGVINPPTSFKGTWNTTASAQNIWIDGEKIRSDASARAVAEAVATNPFDVAIMRCCSRPLAAQTISGTINFVLGLLESNALADFVTKLHVYIRVGETDAVRATLLNNFVDAAEWPTTSTGTQMGSGAQTLIAGAAQAGDTLVIEIGYRSINTSTTSRTGTMRRGCMTTAEGMTPQADLTVGSLNTTTEAGYFAFSNAIVFQDLANNGYAVATVLTGGFTETISLRPAIYTGAEPTPCDGAPTTTHARYNSAFYSWLCPTNQSVTVSADIVNGASTFDTCLQVLTGTPGAFVTVDCRAENDPSFETITFAATAGVTYIFLVTTVYYGGGDLTFTFTPSVAPVADETVFPLGLSGLVTQIDTHTAMGWADLIAANAAIRHFYYIGTGDTPFTPGDSYVWIGTQADGLTLTLNISDGVTTTVYVGPLLEINVFYHWIYVKDGDTQRVYLSSEGGATAYDNALVINASLPLAFIPAALFVYGAAATMIPKAFKAWTRALAPATFTDEREAYNAVSHADLINVTKFQTDTVDTTAGLEDYSGNDRRLGNVIVGGGTGWEIVRGPTLATLPARPYSDDFESYLPGAYTGVNPFIGVIDAARAYEYFTQPTFASWIQAGIGLATTQGFVSLQATATIWFEHDNYIGRCGSVSVWGYRLPQSGALLHGTGLQIPPVPDGGFQASNVALFGFINVDGTDDLEIFNSYDGSSTIIPDVYVSNRWQLFQLFFELSTVNGGGTDVNADGTINLLVDGTLVIALTGLQLTCDNSRWPAGINTWDMVGVAWGGYLDNLIIGTVCYDTACPGIRGAPRTGA